MASVAKRRYGITSKTCMASRVSVYSRRLDSMPPIGGFHTALRADSMHAFGVIEMRKGKDMSKNLLLEYSENLACEIAALCNEHKIDSNAAYQIKKSSSSVFANISEAQYPQSLADMLSKLEIARNVWKPKVGSN